MKRHSKSREVRVACNPSGFNPLISCSFTNRCSASAGAITWNAAPPLDSTFDPARTYVDKTAYCADVLSSRTAKCLVATAPRRYGKSTFVEVLYRMLTGHPDDFRGCQCQAEDSPFIVGAQKFFVIRLDFSQFSTPRSGASVGELLALHMFSDAAAAGVNLTDTYGCDIYRSQPNTPELMLERWLLALENDMGETRPVVLLIDEYDNPMTIHLPENPDRAENVAGTCLQHSSRAPRSHLTVVGVLGSHVAQAVLSMCQVTCPTRPTAQGLCDWGHSVLGCEYFLRLQQLHPAQRKCPI